MQSNVRQPSLSGHTPSLKSVAPKRFTSLLLILCTSLLISCGGSSPPVAVAPAPASSATAVIGPAGGTLTGPDGVQVVIPAGALSADTTIGVARSSVGAPAALPDQPIAGSPYEFTPHNLVFNLPVTIRMPLPAGADGSALFMASPAEDWQAIDATIAAGVAQWTRNSFSWGYAGLLCTGVATLADLYPCSYPSGGANAAATPTAAMTRTAFGSLGLYSGNAGAWAVTQAATVDLTLNYSAAADCLNGKVKLIRWNPTVQVTPANPATIIFEQPVALTPTVFSLPGGTFACTGTTNLDGTPCGSYKKAVGSTTVAVPFSHLDSTANATGTHAFGYSFSCNRPGKPKHSGGDLMTFKVSIPTPSVTFSVGGNVSGLTGAGLVLSNSGSSNLPVSANGGFTFSPVVGGGTPYAVAVLTQPAGQTCTVTNGSGTANANVTNVAVTCTNAYTLGGNLSGLVGTGLVLQNNGGDNLLFTVSGAFSFATKLPANANYAVTVLTQPSGSTCSVAHGTGTVTNADISNVAVTCVSAGPLVIVANSGVTNGTNGLSVFRVNPATGALSFLNNANAGNTPFSVVVTPNGQYAYVGNLVGGTVNSFSIDNATGVLSPIPLSSPGSNNPFGIGMDRLGRYIWVANYGFHTLSTFAIGPTGVLSAVGAPLTGSGPLPYAIAAHPSKDVVYVSHDAGFAITVHTVNANGSLALVQTLNNAISNPRGLTVDPSGRFLFATSANGGVSTFPINQTTGQLSIGSSLGGGLNATNSIAVHPNGLYAYVANRISGANNVVVLSINQTTGALSLAGSTATAGTNPSSVAISASGAHLYVTNLTSNTVSAFAINGGGATLTSLGAGVSTGLAPEGIALTP